MLQFILNYIRQNSFVTECILCVFLFLLPLRKRGMFPVRFLLSGLGIFFGGSFAYLLCEEVLHIHIAFSFFATLMLMIGAFFVCADLSLADATFGAICAFALQHMSYNLYTIIEIFFPMSLMEADILGKIILAAMAAPCYIFFARKLPIRGRYEVSWREAIRAILIILPFAFFMSMIASDYYEKGGQEATALYVICRLYAIICCIFVLWIQTSVKLMIRAEVELGSQKMLFKMQKDQYEISKDNIDLINRKCHDLKHQIAAIRNMASSSQRDQVIREIEDSVMIYDSVTKTGNEALDTILTERSLYCEKAGIAWTCMADGSCLNFVDTIDLYTMLGNALDNAIEAVNQLEDPEQRVISLNIVRRGKIAVIRMENYHQNDIRMHEGMPVTSKDNKDYHGIGLHSIQYTAEKYGGSLSVTTDHNIFILGIVIPIPE